MMHAPSRSPSCRAALGGALLLIALISVSGSLWADVEILKGDPFKGRELLSSKRCTDCHGVWGHGGTLGPDLSSVVSSRSWLDLVGDFWNHTPTMIDAMSASGHPWPAIDDQDMANLLSYLYYLRLFEEPGSITRGSVSYTHFRCGDCHTLGRKGGGTAGPLDRFSAYPSSIMLAQAMWNAGPVMQKRQLARGTDIPWFAATDMADVQAYIRAHALREIGEIELLPLPDPQRGAAVFATKRCGACHDGGAGSAPDLSASMVDMTASQISGILWNHSYAMNDQMRARGIQFPRFNGTEMSDLISHLHFLGFFRQTGEAAKGRQIWEQKGCARCHEGPEAVALDLSASRAISESIALSAAMWNHAPHMHEAMTEISVAWPRFDPGEMGHLTAYLRTIRSTGSGEEP